MSANRLRPSCWNVGQTLTRQAIARLRGNADITVPLSFVRLEPYVLAKRSLTGDTTERVDTRVLQAIYAFAPSDFPAFVGQQVDVFIKAPIRTAAGDNPTSGYAVFGERAGDTTAAMATVNKNAP